MGWYKSKVSDDEIYYEMMEAGISFDEKLKYEPDRKISISFNTIKAIFRRILEVENKISNEMSDHIESYDHNRSDYY